MFKEIFIKTNKDQNLDQFMGFLEGILRIESIEKRESGFYVNGTYYTANTLGHEIKIYVSDDIRYEKFDFCIFVKSNEILQEENKCFQEAINLIENLLKKNKYEFAIPETAFLN
jgi:hypothetical protein